MCKDRVNIRSMRLMSLTWWLIETKFLFDQTMVILCLFAYNIAYFEPRFVAYIFFIFRVISLVLVFLILDEISRADTMNTCR